VGGREVRPFPSGAARGNRGRRRDSALPAGSLLEACVVPDQDVVVEVAASVACGRHRSSYSAITIGGASGPQVGQVGSRRTLNVRKLSSSASYARRRPISGSPRFRSSLIASSAWIEPTMPGSTPSTPASAQLGASSGGGGSGRRHR